PSASVSASTGLVNERTVGASPLRPVVCLECRRKQHRHRSGDNQDSHWGARETCLHHEILPPIVPISAAVKERKVCVVMLCKGRSTSLRAFTSATHLRY